MKTVEKTTEPTLALDGDVTEPTKRAGKGKAVAAHKGQAVMDASAAPATPMEMLNRAVASGADLDIIEKLMTLQERWEAGNARKAFDKAIAAAKKEIPPITRNATGHNSKKYADFAAIARVVDPIISAHGLSYRFRTVQDDRIHVTCILSHEDGHSEQTTLSGPADGSGNKNAIQAIGSTLTYLQRYSLVQMLGLAAAADDDGVAASKNDDPKITDDQIVNLREKCEEVGCSAPKFLKWANVSEFGEIPAAFYAAAIEGLNRFRKAE